MAFQNRTDVVTLKTLTSNGVTTTSSRNCLTWQKGLPVKANGSVTHLTGGGTFRKATDRLLFTRWLESGAPQVTSGTQGTNPPKAVGLESSGGGFNPDIVLTSNSGTLVGGTGCVLAVGGSTPMAIPTEMRNEAATKALLKIASQKAGIGEDLATFHQTLDLIAKPSSDLVSQLMRAWGNKALRPYLRSGIGFLKDVRKLPKEIADTYLEHAYGWMPLMSDIKGAVEMAKTQSAKAMLVHGYAASYRSAQCKPNHVVDISNSAITDYTMNDTSKVQCALWATIDPNCPGLRSLNQLGLANPISLGWEIVPWSFVIDWFCPVGSVLNALTAPAGLIFLDGSMAVRSNLTGEYEHHKSTFDANTSVNSFATGTIRFEGYKRERLFSWPLPGVWANPSPFVGDRPFKALALAISRLWSLR